MTKTFETITTQLENAVLELENYVLKQHNGVENIIADYKENGNIKQILDMIGIDDVTEYAVNENPFILDAIHISEFDINDVLEYFSIDDVINFLDDDDLLSAVRNRLDAEDILYNLGDQDIMDYVTQNMSVEDYVDVMWS